MRTLERTAETRAEARERDGPGGDLPPVVEVRDLVKVYPGGTRALDGISFSVRPGEFFGFLGPNGAGKTTTIRILATLARPTSGEAFVTGLDVMRHAGEVRRRVGFAMQEVALENFLTGRENLELMGRLRRIPGAQLRRRVDELLELTNLTDAAGRLAGTYSGGMRRRLDLASALLHQPPVLFLDEPTEGLDPQSRVALWEELARINTTGTTMFLTTHYMDEADRLCSRVAIIDGGRLLVAGSPTELKRSIGQDVISIRLGSDDGRELADQQASVARLLARYGAITRLQPTDDGVALYVTDAGSVLPEMLRRLDGDHEGHGVQVATLTMSHPSLDDVFLRYTGKRIRAEEADRPLMLGWWG